ncbi:DNA cytosine methyltransferase [Nocardia otitidiscaviarum]|uniref:DNA cytosine methyltransferase n=1 Tax=Nocardia otitidiscaviarum TaxID=1823 RepID=UPI0018933741|nr:DNA cytosine methyltransferase [Nocardia otitidiscaviarum]MBF6183334.1 DNA cytosine methyltransferase [Nocardia otitidiscaviarum]
MHSFYEFFAGGGMARAGLTKSGKWECLFANDIDEKKATSYRTNWGNDLFDRMVVEDVAKLDVDKHLPEGRADLVWASFPCQDLSLAGSGAGLKGERSGTFIPFWSLIETLGKQRRAPRLVVLENVVGALTAGKGKDFVTLGDMLARGGYRFGAVVVNAEHWVPQSRPRLFVIAAHREMEIGEGLVSDSASPRWHPSSLVAAHARLLAGSKRTARDDAWVWWNLPEPPARRTRFQTLADVIEPGDPTGVVWHTEAETKRLIDELMNAVNQKKVRQAQDDARKTRKRVVGTIYKRMRPEGPPTGEVDENGKPIREKVQRAEVRFDDIAGCLRTPGGGSSRQTILIIDRNGNPRSRLLSTREAARLMGLDDNYKLPGKYNEAYHLTGDGVVVDVVDFIATQILEPLLTSRPQSDSDSIRNAAALNDLDIEYETEKVPA